MKEHLAELYPRGKKIPKLVKDGGWHGYDLGL